MRRAASRAACTAGNNTAIRMPMIAITTRSSTSVKPRPGLSAFGHPPLLAYPLKAVSLADIILPHNWSIAIYPVGGMPRFLRVRR